MITFLIKTKHTSQYSPCQRVSVLVYVPMYKVRDILTLRSRHLFSLMAPRQPRKPVTMTMAPIAMTRLAAEREGKEGEKVAKLP